MPLAGVLCDDKDHLDEKFSFADCLLCKKKRGPRRCDNSYQIINAVSQNAGSRVGAGMSATRITNFCPRRVILEEEEDYWERPSNVYQRIRGTVHHLLVEQFSGGLEPYIAEIRFYKEIVVDGVTFRVTGKPDLAVIEEELLIDFKSMGDVTDKWKPIRNRLAQEEHIEQINIYRWLLWGGFSMENDPQEIVKIGDQVFVTITEAGVQYMDMKLQRSVSAPLWTLEETEAYITKKLMPHVAYAKTKVLPLQMFDMWGERHLFCNYCCVREQCDRRHAEDN